MFREAVQITKQTQGGHGRKYTEKLYNLALTYMDQGDFALAEPLLREALEVAEKDLGTKSVDYANGLMNLFTFYYRQRDYVHAEPPLRRHWKSARLSSAHSIPITLRPCSAWPSSSSSAAIR